MIVSNRHNTFFQKLKCTISHLEVFNLLYLSFSWIQLVYSQPDIKILLYFIFLFTCGCQKCLCQKFFACFVISNQVHVAYCAAYITDFIHFQKTLGALG